MTALAPDAGTDCAGGERGIFVTEADGACNMLWPLSEQSGCARSQDR